MTERMIRTAVRDGSNISVESLARGAGYSKYYFTRKFTENFGVSPHEFIILERLSLAKKLLVNSSQSVGEIALMCGFFDTSHMTNCMKKREGISPLGFRRKWRKPI
jgi:AraC-like DNA-binding protein